MSDPATVEAKVSYDIEIDDGGDDADYEQIEEAIENAIQMYEARFDVPKPFADTRPDVWDATTDLGPEYATRFDDGVEIFVRINERHFSMTTLIDD